MQEALIRTLRARRAQIRSRWDAFLRVEKVNTPLANPDTLVFLINQTLDDVFAALRSPPDGNAPPEPAPACEHNPLLAYFLAGEQALLEALILAQAEFRYLDPIKRDADVAELKRAMQMIARRDIVSLEGVFQPRKTPAAHGGPG